MKTQSGLKNFSVALFLCCGLFASSWALADELYIDLGQIDSTALIGPPPVRDSAEAAADLAQVRAVCKGRTPAEETRAIKDSSLAFSLFVPSAGPGFDLDKLPKTRKLLEKVKNEIASFINIPKDSWKRLRPYQLDPSLSVGKPVDGFSYPSGHSARGTVYALLIAELFPEHKEAILEMGRQIGWDRVILAKHFLTDVRAGRVVGQAIVHELMGNPVFQNDLREAREECATSHENAVQTSH